MIQRLRDVLTQSDPDTGYRFGGGDGILTVGGGKYWPGIFVMIRMARRHGFSGPIEVWYRGDCEQVHPGDLLGENVQFYDLDAMGRERGDSRIPTGNVGSGGWEAKLYAMTHTTLDRVLYLDADAYPVGDVSRLFSILDATPFAYWQDLPSQLRSIRWRNVYPEGESTEVMPVQGGQLLVDRRAAWKLVHAGHFMCQNSDYFFRHMYGDQDTWRVGLAMGASGFRCLGKAHWENVAFVCSHEGKPYVVHRCQSKLFSPADIPPGKQRYSNPQYYLPDEAHVFDLLAEALANRGQSAGTVFDAIYNKRLWGRASGAGSAPREAMPYIQHVNALIQSKGYRSVVDLGCGDGIIASLLKCESYRGFDASERAVALARRRNRNLSFEVLDFYHKLHELPAADLLLCKDVLHHWPNDWVERWLSDLFAMDRWRHVVLCQDEKQVMPRQDCHLGGYRALDYRFHPLCRFPLRKAVSFYHKAILDWESDHAGTTETQGVGAGLEGQHPDSCFQGTG